MKTNAHVCAPKRVQRPQEGETKSKCFAGTTKVVRFVSKICNISSGRKGGHKQRYFLLFLHSSVFLINTIHFQLRLYAPKVHLKKKEGEIRLVIKEQRIVDK